MITDNVKIESGGTWGSTHIRVGDLEIRATKLNVVFDKGMIRAEIETILPLIDMEILQENTTITIVKETE